MTQSAKSSRDLKLSPGRRQYLKIKSQHPDALLLFRMGDFYEAFDDDARLMAEVLDIALTARDVGGGARSPLAGIPHHSLESYLGRLVGAGLKVAVCEQTSDPAASRGIVDRAVVRVVTPGTVLEPGLLDQGRNNYLAAVVLSRGRADGGAERAGLAYVDITTSQFVTRELPVERVPDELAAIAPAEVLVDPAARDLLAPEGGERPPFAVRDLPPGTLDTALAADTLRSHFGVATLEAFGCEGRPLAILAAGAVLDFVRGTQRGSLPQITTLRTIPDGGFMVLDSRAMRDLEVFEPLGGRSGAPTIFSTINETKTAMGGRLLRERLARPLFDLAELSERQDGVARWLEASGPRMSVRDLLSRVPDLERLTNRVRTFSATPRDLAALSRGLSQMNDICEAVGAAGLGPETLPRASDEVVALVEAAMVDDPPITVGEGNVIRRGFDPELDELRSLAGEARSHIASLEATARTQTGIKSLKVGYNKVFGYYIEVSRSNLDAVPEDWQRRQTLVNGERFITPDLKEYESRVLNARDRISEVERAAFRRVCGEVAAHSERIMTAARAIAQIDVLAALAEIASRDGWVRPVLDESDVLQVKAGRHPVVERALGPGRFVPNDIDMSSSGRQLVLITGPNMAGKSTYIRQAAVLVLLAQIGSFVPAEQARIGLVDRIFTRTGLADDIAGGQSTFMVEMVETAAILHQATPRSLIVLDEIGRGTSTYDGVSIARAVAEYIHNSPRLGCKALFATHYHEMTALADVLPRAVNYQVAVSEDNGQVVFLHRIVPGGADRSYGVHVGQLAGLPQAVVARAWELLRELESGGKQRVGRRRSSPAVQLSLMASNSEVEEELMALDVTNMTPLEAITVLYRLQEMARKNRNAG